MRSPLWSLTLGLWALSHATPALAAVGPGNENTASPLLWVILALPPIVIMLIFYSILRNARRNQGTIEKSVRTSEEYRELSEEHMRRVESQMERLDERLGRVVELLEAIARGQGRGND
jgi:hypothetical protein